MARVQSNAIIGHYEFKTKESSATPQTENQVQSWPFLDVVMRKVRPSSSCLPAKMSLCWSEGIAFFILDLSLHILDGVTGFHLQSDSLAGQSLHKDWHTTPQMQDQVQGWLFLDTEIGKSAAAIFQLFASKDERLLLCMAEGNALLCWILAFTFSMTSLGSISRAMVLPVKIFMKICILTC